MGTLYRLFFSFPRLTISAGWKRVGSVSSPWHQLFPHGVYRSTLMSHGLNLSKIASSNRTRARPGALLLRTIQQAILSAVLYRSACSRKEILPMPPLSQVCSTNEHPPLPRPTNSSSSSWLSAVDRQESDHACPFYAQGIASYLGAINLSNTR